jgi:hypothetical protein
VSDEPFNARWYAIRVMQSKGYMLKKLPNGAYVDTDLEVMTVFNLQLPSWESLIKKHHFAEDESKAEQMLTGFGLREIKGGASKVLETFAAHLDAQPKRGGSPDWSTASREMTECAYCENRGVVSNVPCRVRNKWGEEVDREYSFACVCDRGRFFAGMPAAKDWMIHFALDRRKRQTAEARANLARLGVDVDASIDEQRRQFRKAFARMKSQAATGRKAAPSRNAKAPDTLNPEKLAMAVFANGDERNEWE